MTLISQSSSANNAQTQSAPTTEIEIGVGYTIASFETHSGEGSRLVLTKYVPEQLMTKYVSAAMHRVAARQLEDGQWFVEIPELQGVWASSGNLKEAADELEEVLIDWLLLKIEHEDRDIPILETISLNTIR